MATITESNVSLVLGESGFSRNYTIGLILAISSCFFIGTSFIIKKVSLVQLNEQGGRRAASGGFGYLRYPMWWCGMLSMGVGELFNFAAYAFAPASLVTPLGALSVLITVILASKFLGEAIGSVSKLGCVLCITGSTMIVLHAPREREILSLQHLGTMIMSPGFLFYLCFVICTSSLLIIWGVPKYGDEHVVVYVLICSLIGSLSVMCCKGIGIGINKTITSTENNLKYPLFYFLIVMLCLTVFMQINYLNKALDIFETSIVNSIYYVFFTSFVLIASAILFEEWKNLSAEDVLGVFSGFLTVIIAVLLLNNCKDANFNIEFSRSQSHTSKNRLYKYQEIPILRED